MQRRWHHPKPSSGKKLFAKNSGHTFAITLGICPGAHIMHESSDASWYLNANLMRTATSYDIELAYWLLAVCKLVAWTTTTRTPRRRAPILFTRSCGVLQQAFEDPTV
ncbi:hypothetical protein Plhal304r1_c017g0062611 [Plasmopara halstedii]